MTTLAQFALDNGLDEGEVISLASLVQESEKVSQSIAEIIAVNRLKLRSLGSPLKWNKALRP